MRKRVYLPPWQRWFTLIIFGGLVLFITYLEYFSNIPDSERLGQIGYALIMVILLAVGIMMWLMASGKLPAYVIEEEEEK